MKGILHNVSSDISAGIAPGIHARCHRVWCARLCAVTLFLTLFFCGQARFVYANTAPVVADIVPETARCVLADSVPVPASSESSESSEPQAPLAADEVPIEDVIKGTLGKGETLAKILAPWASDEEVRNYTAAVQKIFALTSLRAGQAYVLVCDAETEKLKRFEYEIDNKRRLIVEGVLDQPPSARIENLEYDTRLIMLNAQIDDNLFQAVARLHESPQLAILLAGLFGWEVNFIRDVHAGDSFCILLEKHYYDGQFKGYGRTLGATFTNKGKTYEAFLFYDANGREQYYNTKGENLRKTLLQAPLSFTRITSGYGGRRNPFNGNPQAHPAVDYAAPTGTPVKAVGDGTVIVRGWMGGYGNQVVVRHAAGLESMYSHLSAFGRGIAQGNRVRQGQVIAYVGSTGYSTGPHLDFRLRQNGRYINPTKAVNPRSEPIGQTSVPAFRERMHFVRAFMSGSRPLAAYTPDLIPSLSLPSAFAEAPMDARAQAPAKEKPAQRRIRKYRSYKRHFDDTFVQGTN